MLLLFLLLHVSITLIFLLFHGRSLHENPQNETQNRISISFIFSYRKNIELTLLKKDEMLISAAIGRRIFAMRFKHLSIVLKLLKRILGETGKNTKNAAKVDSSKNYLRSFSKSC